MFYCTLSETNIEYGAGHDAAYGVRYKGLDMGLGMSFGIGLSMELLMGLGMMLCMGT